MRQWSIVTAVVFASLVAAPASAKVLLQQSFDGQSSYFSGKQGFASKYCADKWTTALNGGVIARTDSGCTCSATGKTVCDYAVYTARGNSCYKSDPTDNVLVAGDAKWTDYEVSVRLRNVDNDTMGLVFRYKNTANYYALWLSRDVGPGVLSPCDGSFPGARLVKIASGPGGGGGKGQLIAASKLTYQIGKTHLLRVRVKGSSIIVHFDVNGDGKIHDANELLFNAKDSAHTTGKVGLYAYQNGAAPGAACAKGGCWFDDLLVKTLPPSPNADSDGDGLTNGEEAKLGSNPTDVDSDDDGLPDGLEKQPGADSDKDGKINILDPDSDNDGLPDGLEAGFSDPSKGTDLSKKLFIPDLDPNTTTLWLVADTDADGMTDGIEDANHNGRVDTCESDPTKADAPPCGQPDAGSTVDAGTSAPDTGGAGVDSTSSGDVGSTVDTATTGDSGGTSTAKPDGLAAPDGQAAKPLTLTVVDNSDDGGCSAGSTAPHRGGLIWLLAISALVMLRRRVI
ncbi:MAG: hypothetical protein KC502_17275 [Myxococcales bacterium]|nr:hypothetical protein [Myxococcales bacterium]